ncbi:uncharacterized protein LOC141905717 [Tubulanus polymorphus]|uniref:uncharacterized protein LOC141905717 n=1 Tax=Tubulanus polymorphus TaxID=672921 RepID=UPI003DA68789
MVSSLITAAVLAMLLVGGIVIIEGSPATKRQLIHEQFPDTFSPAQASHFQDDSLLADTDDIFGTSPGLSVYDENMWGNYLKPVREIEKRSRKRGDVNALLAKLISMSENSPRGRVTRFRFGTGK